MKKRNRRRWAVVGILLCGALALVAAEKKKIQLQTQPTADASQPVLLRNLPATIKLDLSRLHAVKSTNCSAFSPQVYQAWENVLKCFAALKASFANYNAKHEAACEECRNKTYTQQEMTAAGCLGTDTIDQCSRKLYNKCVNSISMSAGFLLLCNDVMNLTKASQAFEAAFFPK